MRYQNRWDEPDRPLQRLTWRRGLELLLILILWGLVLVYCSALPAFAHSEEEVGEWKEAWVERVRLGLTVDLLSEWKDMAGRHPQHFDLQLPPPSQNPTTAPKRASGATEPASGGSWSGGVEQWRGLVAAYFPASQVSKAMAVLSCETGGTGDPNSYNPRSGASGLFQHLPKYWGERSRAAGWGGSDIFDPTANVAVAAWLWGQEGWRPWTCA